MNGRQCVLGKNIRSGIRNGFECNVTSMGDPIE